MRFVNYFFEVFLALNSGSSYALIPLAIEAFVTSSVPSVTKRLKESPGFSYALVLSATPFTYSVAISSSKITGI